MGILAMTITGTSTGNTIVLKSKKFTPNNKNPKAVITSDIFTNMSSLLIMADLMSISAFCLRFGLIANLAIEIIGMIDATITTYK